MHMVSTLISPPVGGAMIALTGSMMIHSASKLGQEKLKDKLPMMCILGSFVFASQMINFTIPGTGSSGHLGGGMLLAILLGPYAGFLTMAAVLLTQAIFFADGGLLAYGCNVFNLGFYTCFIAYPFIYKFIMSKGFSKKRLIFAVMLSSIAGLQLGAFSVVLETLLSGKTTLPFGSFLLAMLPIHLAIGFIEGIIAATAILLAHKANPLIPEHLSFGNLNAAMKRLILYCAICTLAAGGFFSLFASSNPDGLEWAILKITGQEEVEASSKIHTEISAFEEKIAILPDYNFRNAEDNTSITNYFTALGTSISGILGAVLTSITAALIGLATHSIQILKRIRT